jgi:hypothetical protein
VIDLASTDVTSVSTGLTVGNARSWAGETEWVVVIGRTDEPLGLLRGADLRRANAARPVEEFIQRPIVVLPAELTLQDAMRSRPIRDQLAGGFADIDGVVLTAGSRPIGVWAGESLAEHLFAAGPSRSAIDTMLPGTINIGRFTHKCHHIDSDQVPCGAIESFPEPPDTMPRCRNPRGLTPHYFVW